MTNNSELLLSSAERYAMVTAMSVNTSESISGEQRNQTVRQSRTNIGNFHYLLIVLVTVCD